MKEADEMTNLANALNFDFTDIEYVEENKNKISVEEDNENDFENLEGVDIEVLRRKLEDTLTLFDDSDDTPE